MDEGFLYSNSTNFVINVLQTIEETRYMGYLLKLVNEGSLHYPRV